MKFRLKDTVVKSLSIESKWDIEKENEGFSFSYSDGYLEDESNVFIVKFDLGIITGKGVKLDVIFEAIFECDESITSTFKESHFPVINAPAIAFPYLRVYISNLTLNSGYETIMLPTINFQDMGSKIMAQRNKGDESSL